MNEFYNFVFPVGFQEWMQQIDIIDELWKGIIIGILVSAPMGPVGILTVQRTLNQGRYEGFATGIGATASDFLYALITGYGMSFVVDIIENPAIALLIKVVGSILLFAFGIYTLRSKPKSVVENEPTWVASKKDFDKRDADLSIEKLIHLHKWKAIFLRLRPFTLSGFVITVSNPLIMFLFVALFGQFIFILSDNPIPQIFGYIGIILGALLWWFSLTWIINKVRAQFNEDVLVWINRTIGSIVMIVSSLILVSTLTGHSIPFHL